MRNIKTIWWLIQINAVLCFVFVGVVSQLNASTEIVWFSFILLFIASLLEFVAYHSIYKKHIKTN